MPPRKNTKGYLMEVNKTIESENGSVVFQGSLNAEEVDFVLGIGLNELFARGALPFTTETKHRLVVGGSSESVS